MGTKKLIVNADDFGQSEGINRGIIRAHADGIVTSTSLMVRYPAAAEAAAYSKKNNQLGFGLHIDLGEWIYNDGNWDPVYEVVPMDDTQAVEEEINRQLEFFYHLMERKPSHLDSHQHVHMRETLRPIFSALAQKIDITLRRCSERVNYCGKFYGQLEDGMPYHDVISVDGLKQIISGLPPGITEIACHPGLESNIKTMYRIEREMELGSLCDAGIRELIAEKNIKLCSFEGIPF